MIDLPALTGTAGTCGGFEKLGREELAVVNHRLRVAAPKGAADIPKAHAMMGAPEPAEHESRVIVENQRGGKLVVYAHEIWQTAPADLAARAPGYFRAVLEGATNAVGKIDADPSLVVIGEKPTITDKTVEAIPLLATLVRVSDNSLIAVEYYVNPAAYGEGCQGLAVELARGTKPGTRALDIAGGKRTLDNRVDVDVPAGYVVTHEPGPDFDVFYLRKLVPLAEYPGYLLVYLGGYADDAIPEGSPKIERKGKLAGKNVTWRGFKSPTGGAVVATVPLTGREQLQVVEVATLRGDYLDDLDKIAATIRNH